MAVLHRIIPLAALALTPAAVQAQACAGGPSPAAVDGRVQGHFAYGDVPEADLVEAPPGFAIGQRCMIQRDLLPDLIRLLDAARGDPAVMGSLRGLSCRRSIVRQTGVFCRERPSDPADRAISVAPPGHSEHTTGYAIDFAVRPANGCRDAEACMAATPAYRWLRENATRFGFEQSFPAGNAQNVKWEPWHWRWVGTRSDAPGAAKARFAFTQARARFPADPGIVVPPKVVPTIAPPEPAPPPPAPKKRGKRTKRVSR